MSKRTAFADLGIGPAKPASDEAVVAPSNALLHTVASNPDNPRDREDDPELEELVASYREVGQLQPIGVVSRDVYLRHFPQHGGAIEDAAWVVVNGNRRLEAARQLRWARVDIVVRDHLGDGDDGGSIDEAVMIENIHRKNLAPLREAAFLQRMVERHGSQHKVAKRIGKTQAYVSQRLALLRLEPEIQAAVEAGELKVKQARKLSVVEDREGQLAAWKAERESASDNPVITPSSGEEPDRAVAAASFVAAETPEPARPVPRQAQQQEPANPQPRVLEEPRPAAETTPPVLPASDEVPWGRPLELLHVMRRQMTPSHFETLIREGLEML